MEALNTFKRWSHCLRDRQRMGPFARFLARRFLDDHLFQAAAALAYTTIFALVPLAMVVFGVLSAFPVFDEWRGQLTDYVFSNFVPTAANAVRDKLFEFLGNTGKLTLAGAIGLIVSLLITLDSVESIFNRIWRVVGARPRLIRFLVYWTVLTLGALLAAASTALSAWVFALPMFNTTEGRWFSHVALRFAPMLIELFAITALYRVVPHRTVHFRHALAGALVAVLLLEAVKWALGLYLGAFNSYEKVYGALAALPILLLWIYLCWVAVLLGATFASAISSFRYQPASMRLPAGYELYGLLRLLGRFDGAHTQGRGLHADEMLELEPILTDSLVQQFVEQLSNINLLRRAESGEWLLVRDLNTLTLADLYEACQLRIPVAEARLPGCDDALGIAVLGAMNDLRIPLRDLLKRNVCDIYQSKPGVQA
jgi:membrane protein